MKRKRMWETQIDTNKKKAHILMRAQRETVENELSEERIKDKKKRRNIKENRSRC